jgi:hypothetical protein
MRQLFHFYKTKSEIEGTTMKIAWGTLVRNKLEQLRMNKQYWKVIIPGLLCAGIYWFGISHQSNTVTDLISLQNKRSETILRQLNEINLIVQGVASNPDNTKQQQLVLQALEKDMSIIQKSIVEMAKISDIQQVTNQVALIKNDVDTQMIDIKKSVSASTGGKQYLENSALPFHVISVDVIAGQSYVSVNYANHISPLGMNDILVGWRLTAADYDNGMVEFANEKNQYVKVSLQGE